MGGKDAGVTVQGMAKPAGMPALQDGATLKRRKAGKDAGATVRRYVTRGRAKAGRDAGGTDAYTDDEGMRPTGEAGRARR